MARYRFLQDAYIGERHYLAGTFAEMPTDWVPAGYVEPMDVEAVAAFFAAGPQPTPLVRQQWDNILITTYPATYWRSLSGGNCQLTGLGSGLGVVKSDRRVELP